VIDKAYAQLGLFTSKLRMTPHRNLWSRQGISARRYHNRTLRWNDGAHVMANFTPASAAIGGALIGLSAALLMLLTGRIAGVSGIFGGCLGFGINDKAWRIAFIAGLILAPLTANWVGYAMPSPQMPASWTVIIAAGLLVGFGTRLGGGCTSGHGICGIARLSARSITATAIFMFMAIVVVAFTRHVLAG
jgi:uncharacterized protein